MIRSADSASPVSLKPGRTMQSRTGVAVESPLHRPPSEEAVEAAIAEAVVGYRRVFGERLAQVWLFGSRAVGNHRPYSDVDLLAVLHEEGPIGRELDLLYSVAEPIRLAYRVYIDGHPTTLRELETSDDDFHFFVRSEGRRVDA